MTATTHRGYPSEQVNLGDLDPRDDEGFARVLGEWTRQVPFLARQPGRADPQLAVTQVMKRPAPGRAASPPQVN